MSSLLVKLHHSHDCFDWETGILTDFTQQLSPGPFGGGGAPSGQRDIWVVAAAECWSPTPGPGGPWHWKVYIYIKGVLNLSTTFSSLVFCFTYCFLLPDLRLGISKLSTSSIELLLSSCSPCEAQQVLPLSRCLALSNFGGVDDFTPEKLDSRPFDCLDFWIWAWRLTAGCETTLAAGPCGIVGADQWSIQSDPISAYLLIRLQKVKEALATRQCWVSGRLLWEAEVCLKIAWSSCLSGSQKKTTYHSNCE